MCDLKARSNARRKLSTDKKRIINEIPFPSFQLELKPRALLKTENRQKELWFIAAHLVLHSIVQSTCWTCMILCKKAINKDERNIHIFKGTPPLHV